MSPEPRLSLETLTMFPSLRRAAVLVGAIALGACDDDPVAPTGLADVRVVHASADAPSVDVLVDDAPVLSNVPFKAASDYLAVPSGSRNLKVRISGTTTIVIEADATVADGLAYTVLATGPAASIAPLVLEDNLTDPAAGNIKLRLVHASPTAGNVDIYVTAPAADINAVQPTLSNVPFRAASPYLEVPAGTYRVRVTPVGTKTVAIDANNVTLASGQIRTAVAVDAVGGGGPLGAILLVDKD
jgi:hypothetical protein